MSTDKPAAIRAVIVTPEGQTLDVPVADAEASMVDILAGGELVACIVRSVNGDLGVQLFEDPSVELLQLLETVARACRSLLQPQPPPSC